MSAEPLAARAEQIRLDLVNAAATRKTAAEELARMNSSARLAEIVDDSLEVFEGAGGIRPQIGTVRLAVAGLEHLHRGLVGMQHAVAQHHGFEGLQQWLQPDQSQKGMPHSPTEFEVAIFFTMTWGLAPKYL